MAINGKLDHFDLKLLRVLQEEGRIPVVELAERIGLSKSPCLKRLRRLESDGYIKGYRAELDPDKIDQNYLVYVQVTLSSTKWATLEAFNEAVKEIPEILACDMMGGGFDYILKIRTRNIKAYRQFLGDVLSDLPGVGQTSTFPVLEQVKNTHSLMLDDDIAG